MMHVPEEVMEAAVRIATVFRAITEQEKADVLAILREAQKYPSRFPPSPPA
jgi:hypothetical protein